MPIRHVVGTIPVQRNDVRTAPPSLEPPRERLEWCAIGHRSQDARRVVPRSVETVDTDAKGR
jgi:hypothetical protein